MRRLRVDVATFTLIIGGVNGAIYYLAPLIPDPGLRGFAVVFLELFTVWAATEEKDEDLVSTKTTTTVTSGTGTGAP